jgi:hypothetical protein
MSSPEQDRPEEQRFFADPAIDRVMGFAYALSAEVYVLRDYIQRLEGALVANGTLSADAVETFKRTPEQAAGAAKDRDAFVAALMENVIGKQISKGG